MPTTRENHPAGPARPPADPARTRLRGEVLPERVPAAGLLILRDGEPGEAAVTLSPLRYRYQHRAEIEAVVQGGDRDTTFNTLAATIGAAPRTGHWAGSATWSRQRRRSLSICRRRTT
jgi:hypothetical protein